MDNAYNGNNEDQVKRLQAEIANTVQRAERRVQDANHTGWTNGLEVAFEVFDELERAADAALQTPRVLTSVRQGFDIAVKAAENHFGSRGIKRFRPTAGDAFDARTMEAISHDGVGGAGARVSRVFTSGWRIAGNTSVLRPARVAVY